MKLERASNRGSLATYVRNVETFAELSINPPIAEGWLKSMARLVESMPDDLRKEIRCIGYHSDNTWPPNRDGDWNPGYLIHANPDLIMSAHERQWLSDVFFRVDGGHPGIGWLFPNVPWIDGKPGRDSLDAPELDPEHEIELYIDPVGWGARSTGYFGS